MSFSWDNDSYGDFDDIQPPYWRIQPGLIKALTIALSGPAFIVLIASMVLENIPDIAVTIAFATLTVVGSVQMFFVFRAWRYDS